MTAPERPAESSFRRSSGVSSGSFSNPPYWLIVESAAEGDSSRGSRNQAARVRQVLSLDLAGGRALPVFGSEEGAELFSRAWMARIAVTAPVEDEVTAEAMGVQWRPRGAGVGELISLLSGSAASAPPCAGVERIALDPPPEMANALEADLEPELGLVSLGRKCFIEHLMGRGRAWFDGTRDTRNR